ncbi:MAG: GNAT family N-acetyltransferase [Kouleothrix sp.]|nr:GNAT family N-acetyltransferase [Kouleothrix sp.]
MATQISLTRTIQSPRGEVTIRPTREDDAPAYRELRLLGLQDHPEVFGADYETSSARPIEFWQERMRTGSGGEHGVTYVAEAASELIGMTTLVRNDMPKTRHAGSIFGVYTRPDWRGTGVADALLEACAAYASARGLRLVRLGVVTTNAGAIRLYLRCGFSVYGVEPESIQHGGVYYDELLMARRV